MQLSTYKAFQNPKGMKNSVMKQMVLGISSRNYEEAIDSFVSGYGIKKSSISRHFIKATAEQMREFMERDLSHLELCAIFIDGIEFKKQMLVVALGLDKTGKKHILGLRLVEAMASRWLVEGPQRIPLSVIICSMILKGVGLI